MSPSPQAKALIVPAHAHESSAQTSAGTKKPNHARFTGGTTLSRHQSTARSVTAVTGIESTWSSEINAAFFFKSENEDDKDLEGFVCFGERRARPPIQYLPGRASA